MYSNPEDAKAYQRAYYLRHKEKIKEKAKLQRAIDPDSQRKYHQTFYYKHQERMIKLRQQYRINHADKIKEYRRKYFNTASNRYYDRTYGKYAEVCKLVNQLRKTIKEK